MSTSEQDSAKPRTVPTGVKVALLVVVVIVIPALPSAALSQIGLSNGTSVWALTAVATALATMVVGLRLGLRVGLALAVLLTLGIAAATTPWAAALVMAVGAALYGVTARWGVTSWVVTAPIALAFTIAEAPTVNENLDRWGNAVTVGGIAVVAAAWGMLTGAIAGRWIPSRHAPPVTTSRALGFAALLAIGCAIAMWLVVSFRLGHTGAWIVLTLLVAFQPYLQDTWEKSLHRLWGTLLGVAIALVIGLLIHERWVLVVIGLALMTAAFTVLLGGKRPYWQYATLLTPAIVLLEGAGNSVIQTDRDRLIATAIGVVIAVALVAVSQPVYRRIADRLGEDRY